MKNGSLRLARLVSGVLGSCLFSAAAFGAPFAITYSGTMNASTIPGVNSGEAYTVTLVMDNGGATAASQTWVAGDLTCAMMTMNNSNNVGFAQDLVASAATMAIGGSATTDAGGALTANYTSIISNGATNFTVAHFAPVAPINWFFNSINNIFYDSAFGRSFGDASGGTQMAVGNWTNPQPFTGRCDASAAIGNYPVPTLSQWGLVILASLMALGSVLVMRRRQG